MTLFDQLGCSGCHKTSGAGGFGPGLGPVWAVSGSRVEGLSAEEYLEQSIRDPMAYIVDDYNPIMPRTFADLSPHDVDSLVAYLFSLSDPDEVDADVSQVSIVGDVLIVDSFDSQTLAGGSEASWVSEAGEWSAATGALVETSGADTDHRIVQSLGQREYDINPDITWFGGKTGHDWKTASVDAWLTCTTLSATASTFSW